MYLNFEEKMDSQKYKTMMETAGFIFAAQKKLLLEVCLEPDHRSLHETWIRTQ